MRERDAKDSDADGCEQDCAVTRGNLYDHASASVIATQLEATQINMFHLKGGTGFAAEDANALHDRLAGHTVEQVGWTNRQDGPDRIVDGVAVQTKYYDTAAKTVGAAFDRAGQYRYSGQSLEVPADQYAQSLELMRARIMAGNVPGVTDPAAAEEIVQKGHITYRQARNIAKAGSIDNLTYHAKGQFVASSHAFAISFCVNFARMKWDGKATDEALADSLKLALESGVKSFVTGMIVAPVVQSKPAAALGRVPAQRALEAVARTKVGKDLVTRVAQATSGKPGNLQQAIARVSKLGRTTVLTSVVTTVVVCTPDFYRAAFRKSISWKQFGKNVAVNGAGVAGGVGGGVAGAAVGRAIGSAIDKPGAGNAGAAIGGVVGSIAGGMGASAGSKYLLDGLIEDDAKVMIRLLPGLLEPLATDYMLLGPEVDELIQVVRGRLDAAFLREMFRSVDRQSFVYQAFEPACEAIIRGRPVVAVPELPEVAVILAEMEGEALS